MRPVLFDMRSALLFLASLPLLANAVASSGVYSWSNWGENQQCKHGGSTITSAALCETKAGLQKVR